MSDRQPDTAALFGRLLGPTGPQLTCEECFDRLDVYVEAELRGDDADALVAGMRAHLDGCPACAEEHESLRELLITLDRRQKP